MGEKGSGKPLNAETEKPVVPAVEKAPKFAIPKLRENSISLFGVTSSTFDGAFFGCEDKEMGIKDAKARIRAWLGKEAR